MVLYTLSIIWKNGGVFNIMKNGEIELDLSNAKEIPEVVLKTAESIYDEIKSTLLAVEGKSNVDKTIWKMFTAFCGWQQNEKIKQFLNGDDIGLNTFLEWQAKLNANGWTSVYDHYEDYENDETNKLKAEIFKRAVEFARANK